MVFVYALAVLIPVIALGAVLNQIRLSRHRGVSREAFIEEFQKNGISLAIAATVYDYYRSLAISKKFTVSPDDSYDEVFGEAHEDIDDDAEDLVRQLGMEMPIEPVLREWETPLRTLRDMVLWLNWIRERQETATVRTQDYPKDALPRN
jgi:hypothetical protein